MTDDDSLLTIGAFARAADLPASALRHYDEVGLLAPAHTDPTTGYRFYDAEQMARATLLARLRALGLGIEEMRTLLRLAPARRAERLGVLADEAERAGRLRAAALRALAAEGARDGGEGWARVGGPALAAALRRVAAVAGDAPHDAVVVTLAGGLLTLCATDRYVLARRLLTPAASAGAGAAVVGLAEVELLAGTAAAAGVVTLAVGSDGIRLDDALLVATRDSAGFPDLGAVMAGHAPAGRTTVAIPRTDLLGREVVAIDGVEVHLTPALVQRAIASLVGDTVTVAVDEPTRPLLVTSPDQPEHVVLVMPRRPR